jgi:hypothetical protein
MIALGILVAFHQALVRAMRLLSGKAALAASGAMGQPG